MRLDRYLSAQGCGSRSEVRARIRAGEVLLDGKSCRDPAADMTGHTVTLRGQEVKDRGVFCLMMNKPDGVLTAARDERCPTVMDLLPEKLRRMKCMPVGRLDKDTTGLLLFTNDGQLAHRLIAPKRHVEKVYLARTGHTPTADEIAAFSSGVDLGDFVALPARLSAAGECAARIAVCEGKFHQVKRMMAAVGNEVIELKRIAFGPIALDESLAPGAFRFLDDGELAALREAAGRSEE